MDFDCVSPPLSKKLQDSDNKRYKSRFLCRLYDLLEANQYPELITWSNDGDKIIIKDIARFTDLILPILFNHKNFSSFVRQLHMYNFRKNKESGYFCCYSNPNFKRNKKSLLERVERRKTYKAVSQPQQIFDQNVLESLEDENNTLRKSEKILKGNLELARNMIAQLHIHNQKLKTKIQNSGRDNITPQPSAPYEAYPTGCNRDYQEHNYTPYSAEDPSPTMKYQLDQHSFSNWTAEPTYDYSFNQQKQSQQANSASTIATINGVDPEPEYPFIYDNTSVQDGNYQVNYYQNKDYLNMSEDLLDDCLSSVATTTRTSSNNSGYKAPYNQYGQQFDQYQMNQGANPTRRNLFRDQKYQQNSNDWRSASFY